MAVQQFNSDTGLAALPDTGTLSYNSVTFSALYKSTVSGRQIKDNAGRTVKWVEYTITVDGIVTPTVVGGTSIDAAFVKLRQQLSKQGGILTYKNKGFGPLVVNAPGSPIRDVAWGPIPEVLEFLPLGGGLAAFVKFQVVVRISEYQARTLTAGLITGKQGPGLLSPVVQFNQEVTLSFDEDCFTQISIRGTLEIPLTRNSVDDRTVATTVDALRQRFLQIVPGNPNNFRVTRRNFHYSRDRRTCEWEYVAEEIPFMGLPPWCSSARGHFTVRPIKPGVQIMQWMCTLRGTYTVRKDRPRRTAYDWFVALWRFRMNSGWTTKFPAQTDNSVQAQQPGVPLDILASAGRGATAGFLIGNVIVPGLGGAVGVPVGAVTGVVKNVLGRIGGAPAAGQQAFTQSKAIPHSFEVDEGLYLDSRTISFSASWRLLCPLSHLLIASGVWRTSGVEGGNTWARSMFDVQGYRTWLNPRLDPRSEVIVDLGS